jgi:class 3 adenylate cyclase
MTILNPDYPEHAEDGAATDYTEGSTTHDQVSSALTEETSLMGKVRSAFWSLVSLRIKSNLGWVTWEDIPVAILDRHKIWTSVGQPIHPVSLEFFNDSSLERSFQIDAATQSYRRMPLFSAILWMAPVMSTWIRFQVDRRQTADEHLSFVEYFLLDPSIGFIFLSLIQMIMYFAKRTDPEWLISHFQRIQHILAISGSAAMITWMYIAPVVFAQQYRWPFEETLQIAIIYTMLVGLLKLTWTHTMYVSLLVLAEVLGLRWIATGHIAHRKQCWFKDGLYSVTFLACITIVSCTVNYLMERIIRKDFVLSYSLVQESDRTEKLLNNILPQKIADQLKDLNAENPQPPEFMFQELVLAERHSSVSVVYADIINFSVLSTTTPPSQLISMLNSIFSAFDDIAQAEGLEKIKTIGDAYVAAAGVPENNPMHAAAACRFALRICNYMAAVGPVQIRVGVDTGPVVAGVVGSRRFAYELWGRCVDGANKMEQGSRANAVRISQNTKAALREAKALNCFEVESDDEGRIFLTSESDEGRIRAFSALPRRRGFNRRLSSSAGRV